MMSFALHIRRRYRYCLHAGPFWMCFSSLRRIIVVFFIIILAVCFIITINRDTCWLDRYRARLFCFVLTRQEHLPSRARAVYETWGRRCGRFVFISRLNASEKYTIFDNEYRSFDDETLPIQYIPDLPDEEYFHLADKIRVSLLFFHKHYPDFDWYLKADDDTYVIVENLLRFLVSTVGRHPAPLLYGYRFRENYYVSGGAGYVLTQKGLRLFGSQLHNDHIYMTCNISMEDMMVGSCLKKVLELESLGDYPIVGESIDEDGRERFHPLQFRVHFNGPANKTKREWIYFRPFHHNLFGYEGISETSISFHYTSPEDMYETHALLYDIRQFDKQMCLAS